MPNDEIQLELREIGAGDRVTGLSLGDEAFTPLKTFVQRHAKAYAEQMLAKSYGVFEGARLAVDQRYRGTGLGLKLVDFSLGLARDTIASAVGCRFVVLDAKQQSVHFYEKIGFRMINTETNRARIEPIMFLDLKGTPAALPDA